MTTYIGKKVHVKSLNLRGTVLKETTDKLYQTHCLVMCRNGKVYEAMNYDLEVRSEVTAGEVRGRKPFKLPKGVVIDWNLPNRVIAKFLGVTPLTVFSMRRRLGVPSNPRGPREWSL